jgi:hypothetical protein
MRVVALEEHYTVPGIVNRIDPDAIRRRGFPGPDVVWGQVIKRNELAHLGDARLADMDASGITVQVLSVAGVPRASRWHGTITMRWPRPPPVIRTDSAVSRICRCIRPKRRQMNWNGRSRISASTGS